MTFQSTVSANIGFGVVGEIFLDGVLVAQPGILESADASENVFGSAFTVVAGAAQGSAPTVQAGGTGVFAGLMINPKSHASYGTTAGGPLAPTLTLPNAALSEFCLGTAGVIISLAGDANIGDKLEFVQASGALNAIAPGATVTGGSTIIAGSKIVRYDVASGLAVVSLTANIL